MTERRTNPATGEDALRAAFEAHYAALARMATLVTGDPVEAEDLVQEAFVRAAEPIERLTADAVRPYLRATVMNLWRNSLRRRPLEGLMSLRAHEPGDLPMEEHDALWRSVLRLPPRQRACLVLRYYEELSEAEAARVLGCSVGTIKSQTSRALRRLREELDDEP